MYLDLPSLMIMESFVAACAGAILLVAWSQNSRISVLALWRLANIAIAGGIFSLMLGAALRPPFASTLGGSLLVLAPGLMWKASRAFGAKPAPLALALVGTAVAGLASGIPDIRDVAGSLSLGIGAVYLFAAATTLWLGRKERLATRGPMIAFTAVHAALLLIGTHSTLDPGWLRRPGRGAAGDYLFWLHSF
jgi:hypothetical protein